MTGIVQRQRKAADDLEKLEIELKEAIKQIREIQEPQLAYALVYELRRRMGTVAAYLGVGAPGNCYKRQALDILDGQTEG